MRRPLAAAAILVALSAQQPGNAPDKPFQRPGDGPKKLHESFLKRAKDGPTDVLFVGDSITQGWNGKDAKKIAPVRCRLQNLGRRDRGEGGRVAEVNARLQVEADAIHVPRRDGGKMRAAARGNGRRAGRLVF
jgi:hypothetical protein